MRAILSAMIIMALAFFLLLGACSPGLDAPQVIVPDPTPSPQEKAQPTQAPTPAPPVTPPDISQFLPGLSESGATPENEYTIGIIMDQTQDNEAWQREIDGIGEKYAQRFGVTIITQLTGKAKAMQMWAARYMAERGVDFLIISPAEADSLEEVAAVCEQNGTPYITINRRITAVPGEGNYICSIENDDYMAGVLTGMSIMQKMTEKYGEPKGNIGEITADVSDRAAQLKSMGIRRVFEKYSELNVVCSMVGGSDADAQYKAAGNVMKAFRRGELDGIVTMNGDIALQTLQAALDTDRDDVIGSIWTMGATRQTLTGVWHGQFAQAVECPCQSGMVAIEYALQYLEGHGEDIPPVVVAMTRVFEARTDAQRDGIAQVIAEMDEKQTGVIFEHMGAYLPFLPDTGEMRKFYPQHYFQYRNVEAFLRQLEPFSTGPAHYAAREGEDE